MRDPLGAATPMPSQVVAWATEAIEVTRPAATTTLGIMADVAAVAAVAGTATLAGLLLGRRARALGRPWLAAAWTIAVTASVAEVVLRVLDLFETRAATSILDAVGTQRVAAALARIVVLVIAVALDRGRHHLRPRERSLAGTVVAVVLIVTIALDAPRAGSTLVLALQVAGTLVLVGVAAWLAITLHDRRPDLHGSAIGAAASGLACVVLAIPLVAPPRQPSSTSEVATFADGRFDVTLAPGSSGRNEVHVYVFDTDDVAVNVGTGRVTVDGGGAADLLAAGGNHLVAYDLSLPDRASWQLTVEGRTHDGRTLATTMEVDRP